MELINFELYNEDFVWDYRLHFPIPTINYVMRRTGTDLLRLFDTELVAEGNVISVTRTAKNFLFSNRVDMQAWEYNIAHDKELLYDVLEYVLEFINFAFISGDYQELFNYVDDKKISLSLKSAKNNLLGAKKVLRHDVKLYEGY